MLDLFKGLNIPINNCNILSENSSIIIEPSSIFHKPADVIQYNIERAKQKFDKSVQIIGRIENLKVEEKKKAENMIKKTQEREKKLLEKITKREEEHEKFTMNTNEQRYKILQKKKEIVHDLDNQLFDYGIKLSKRMEKLSIANQEKLREMVSMQHEKIKKRINDDYSKITNDVNKSRIEEGEIRKMIDDLHLRIEKRIFSYEDNVKKRISNARENNIKVDIIFSKSLIEHHKKTEEKIKKIVAKSIASDEKRKKKEENFKKYSVDVRNSVISSFVRNNKGIDNLNERELKRIEQIEQRVTQKSKIFNNIKSKFEEAFREKKQRNSNRFEGHNIKYAKALENQVKFI